MNTDTANRVAAFLAAAFLLTVPALWNGFPLLFYDSGAYLGRYFDGTLSPGRSAAYGFALGIGRWPNFWPVVIAQSVITVWVVALFLRAHGLGARPILLFTLFAILTVATSLPWLTGQLMPDFLAGPAVLAIYLLVFRAAALARWEQIALVLLAAFAGATHNATLAVMVLMLAAGTAACVLRPPLVPVAGLMRTLAAIALSIVMVFAANLAVVGKLAWTPGGTAFFFSRLVHDGIVHRFLEDNCPDPRFELCKHRARLPDHANDFLWHQGERGPFVQIGGFENGADEMRTIALESLWQYPGLHLWTAFRSTVAQLFAVGTGWGIVHNVWDAYGHIERLTPEAVPAAHSARQRLNELDFRSANALHEPVAWLSTVLLAVMLLLVWRFREFAWYGPMAATFSIALLANAFVCGALSNAHDRYGARIVWIATLFVVVAVARALPAWRRQPAETPAPAIANAAAPAPVPSYFRGRRERR